MKGIDDLDFNFCLNRLALS